MKGFHEALAVAGLIIASPALAGESLINGEPLQYGHDYHCNGERVEIARCRDNDDASYCQVYYPDRPYHDGMMIQPVEMRGDIIRKLTQCASSGVVAPQQRVVPAPGQEGGAPLAPAPGLGLAHWFYLMHTGDVASFFTEAGIRRAAPPRGWFTNVFLMPKDYPQLGLAGVEFQQVRYAANCAAGTTALMQINWYDQDKKLLRGVAFPKPAFQRPTLGTLGAAQYNIMCSHRQALGDAKPLIGDGDYLFLYVHTIATPESSR